MVTNMKFKRQCEFEGCGKLPSFDTEGGKGRCCAKHKTADMIEVKHRRCETDGCLKVPSFDVLGGKGRFCALVCLHLFVWYFPSLIYTSYIIYRPKHKTPDMVDVKSKKCEFEECSKQPCFNVPGGKGRFCGQVLLTQTDLTYFT